MILKFYHLNMGSYDYHVKKYIVDNKQSQDTFLNTPLLIVVLKTLKSRLLGIFAYPCFHYTFFLCFIFFHKITHRNSEANVR